VKAFNSGAIFSTAGRSVGLLDLAVIILALIGLVYVAVTGLIMPILILGWIINLFLGVASGIFHARYPAGAYESVPARSDAGMRVLNDP
jgi:hypothetical protein